MPYPQVCVQIPPSSRQRSTYRWVHHFWNVNKQSLLGETLQQLQNTLILSLEIATTCYMLVSVYMFDQSLQYQNVYMPHWKTFIFRFMVFEYVQQLIDLLRNVTALNKLLVKLFNHLVKALFDVTSLDEPGGFTGDC